MKAKYSVIGLLVITLIIYAGLSLKLASYTIPMMLAITVGAIAFFLCLILQTVFKDKNRKYSSIFKLLSLIMFYSCLGGSFFYTAHSTLFPKRSKEDKKSSKYSIPGKNYGHNTVFIEDIAYSGNPVAEVKLHLEKGAFPNAKDRAGNPVLHLAAKRGKTEVMKLLLDHGANPNVKDDFYASPALNIAVGHNQPESVKLLLENGANPNGEDDKLGLPALHLAVRYQNTEIVKLLLKHGANQNWKDDFSGESILHLAIETSQPDIVKLLLDHGADPDATDKDGDTPLHKAASWSKLENAKVLIEGGADLNSKTRKGSWAWRMPEETPLITACRLGKFDVAALLIEHGADVKSADRRGDTALMVSCRQVPESGLVQVLFLGLARQSDKADRAHKPDFDLEQILNTIDRLLSKGADINRGNDYGYTPLIQLVQQPYWGMPNPVDFNVKILKHLIAKGARIDLNDKLGNPVLIRAFTARGHMVHRIDSHAAIIKYLIENGADINCRSANNQTLLMLACQSKDPDYELIEFMLDHGADIHAKDRNSRSALNYFAKDEGILKLLKKYDSKSK